MEIKRVASEYRLLLLLRNVNRVSLMGKSMREETSRLKPTAFYFHIQYNVEVLVCVMTLMTFIFENFTQSIKFDTNGKSYQNENIRTFKA